MAIEDTFGYRFVRTSLVMLNCIVLLRLLSLLLQYSHVFEPTFVLFILLIGKTFGCLLEFMIDKCFPPKVPTL